MRHGVLPDTIEFAFDLRSPWTYLAAERAGQLLPTARWVPVLAPVIDSWLRADVKARAAQLRMPLVSPERSASGWRGAMRVASYAAEHDRAAAFVIAAGRLAYCGGFDLDDPEILAEAAAAACLPLGGCLAAAGDRSRDAAMLAMAAGADRLPAVRIGRRVFGGEERLVEAAAAARQRGVARVSATT